MSKIKNKNHNENNNVIILDFGDYDIKKKKKKKVKKKVNKKKEAIDKLKNTLKLFDEILNTAKQEKINIPEELGKLPDNIKDINTIKEINELNIDLQNRIQAIREMIQKKSQQVQVPSSIDGLPNLFIPSQEIIQPQIQRPIGMPGIIPPRIINESDEDKKKVDDNNLERVRKALQQEQLVIINKLPEAQRSEAMAEFRKNFNIKPSRPENRPLPPTPTNQLPQKPQIPSSELETRLNFKIGSKNIPEFKAPKGWFLYFDRYKQYIERLEFVALQNTISEGVYHIPLQNYTNLIQSKTDLLKDYTTFLNSLSPELQTQMKTDSFFVQLDNDIFTNLRLEPKDLLMKMWREQGKMIKEITQGDEKSDIEKKLDEFGFKDPDLQKQKNNFETKLTDLSNLLLKVKIKIDKNYYEKIDNNYYKGNIDKQNIDKQNIKKNQSEIRNIEIKLNDAYNKLDDVVKISVTTEIDRIRKKINDMRIRLGNTIRDTTPATTTPDILPLPLDDEEIRQSNLSIIHTYVNTPVSNYTIRIERAIRNIFGDEFADKIKEIKNPSQKRKKIQLKLDEKPVAEKIKSPKSSSSPPNPTMIQFKREDFEDSAF